MAELYKEYSAETLQKIQKLELEILKDFDELCEKNGIDYFCCGGTAIGAVRHKGFIPWDDDIDVALLRRDYDHFLQCAKDQLTDKYYLLNTENDPEYPLMTTRMCLRGTRFQEECFKDLTCSFGIFLDIYCFDYVPDDEKAMKKAGGSVWLKGKLMILCAIGDPILYFTGIKADIIRLGCRIIHACFRLFRIKPEWFYRNIRRELEKNGQKSERVAYQFDPQPFTSIIDLNDIVPTKRVPFETLSIRCPAKVEGYLEKRYGDYMMLPPAEKRHNHPPYYLDFGQY